MTYFFCELLALRVCHLGEDVPRLVFLLNPEVGIPTEVLLWRKKDKENIIKIKSNKCTFHVWNFFHFQLSLLHFLWGEWIILSLHLVKKQCQVNNSPTLRAREALFVCGVVVSPNQGVSYSSSVFSLLPNFRG